MSRRLIAAPVWLALAGAAQAQHAGHDMGAMTMPPAADPHAAHRALPPMPALPPPPPGDHAAERFYPPAAMARARAVLASEHGGMAAWKVAAPITKYRPNNDGYGWKAEAWRGGDIDRLVLKTEGEGDRGRLEHAEVQGLWSRAVTPYFDLRSGLRQDLQAGPRRTYATLGFEGLAPYRVELEGAVFVSNRGDLTARLEAWHDLRLTQKLILESRAELNFAAQDAPELGLGSGLSTAQAGLRLRYEIRPEIAPYIGVDFARKSGETADLARRAGVEINDTRAVLGLRAWY